jgi:hypothetical protein
MLVRFAFSSLKDGRWYENLLRFVLGGAATVMTGLIGAKWGPGVGGLFLAFPAMLCASATLVQPHEKRRNKEAGMQGTQRGKDATALDAGGAALGSIGLLVFAATVLSFARTAPWTTLALASSLWGAASVSCWWIYKRIGIAWFAKWIRIGRT